MNVKAALVLAFATLVASPALAVDNYTIPETIDQSAVSAVDRPVDIIGIKPGMSASDALAILAKDYGGEDNIDRFHMKIGTRQVQSQQFDTFYKGGEILKKGIAEVYLASPAAGNKVFAARRVVNLKVEDGLPTVAAMKAQLVEKYGKPSAEMYYNKDLFDRFGVPYPKDGMTWDEVYALAQKVTRTEGGVAYKGFAFQDFYLFTANQLSLSFVDGKTEKSVVNSDGWKKLSWRWVLNKCRPVR